MSNIADKIRLVIVDDHQMLIDGIKSLLKSDKRFEVVGETTKSPDAIGLVNSLQPHILLSDIDMPEMNGIELTKLLKSVFPSLQVLVLSMHNDRTMIGEIVNAGAAGYILKNTGKEELVTALLKIYHGGMFFSDDVAAEMMRPVAEPAKPANNQVNLTTRELEIVKLIAEEYNNAQIADKLFISERTVETHRKNILRKTNTHNVLGLVKFAMDNGIV
ncbi:MAG: response regulator transcription factor [Bacteroidota bacterium]|nr:response regulator transcription factor [Bacteroidota bacterium]